MFELSWNTATVSTAQAAAAITFGYLAFILCKYIKNVNLKIIASIPFWILAAVFGLGALITEMSNMFGPPIAFVRRLFL